MTGKTRCEITLKRAVGCWETVRKADCELTLEQSAESCSDTMHAAASRWDRVSRRYNERAFIVRIDALERVYTYQLEWYRGSYGFRLLQKCKEMKAFCYYACNS